MVPDTTSVSMKIIMSNCSNSCEVGLKNCQKNFQFGHLLLFSSSKEAVVCACLSICSECKGSNVSLWSGGWRIWQLYYDDLCNAVMVNYVSTSCIKGSGQLNRIKFIVINFVTLEAVYVLFIFNHQQ